MQAEHDSVGAKRSLSCPRRTLGFGSCVTDRSRCFKAPFVVGSEKLPTEGRDINAPLNKGGLVATASVSVFSVLCFFRPWS